MLFKNFDKFHNYFFINIEIFFVVSLRMAPKLIIEAYILRLGKHNYPTRSIVYL